jgi:LTXXQ motif family protein
MKRLMMATAFTVAALGAPTWAQSPAEHDSHHPKDSAKSEPAPATPPPAASQPGMGTPQGGMGGMQMMGMMNDMKNMMSSMSMMNSMGMMQTMGMMGPGTGGMATIDRVEGRIAFLRTELKITDVQASAWNGFADALRANAKKLNEVRASMMPKPGDGQPPAPTMADRLDLQEQWLVARLDGTRAMKSTFSRLNEALSDEQTKAANDLLAPHIGMEMMPMMASQMQPGQMGPGTMGQGRMQPGRMGPGSMQPGQMQPPGTGNK